MVGTGDREAAGVRTSGSWDGRDSIPSTHPFLGINPHLKFYNNQRGYVLTKITNEQLSADFEVLPYVSTPGAPAYTRASFVIEDRVPGLHQTYDRPLDPIAARSPADPTDQHRAQHTINQETTRP